MKNIILYTLSALIICQTFMSTIILTGFYINRGYIAKNQCENRFANSSCKGQCVLMKKLREKEEKEQKNAESKIKEVQLFVYQTDIFQQHSISSEIVDSRSVPSEFLVKTYSNNFLQSIFRPPIA
ncbi:hypothetical protein [Sphingobacterium hungaricum]